MDTHIEAKIMLVEDDPTMQNILKTLLEIEGFKVVTVPDSHAEAEVVSIIKGEMPDLVLLDVHLRRINGIDIMRLMRADPELKAVRVVMSSGMEMKRQCLQAGANAFLLKPYMPDELIRLLHSTE